MNLISCQRVGTKDQAADELLPLPPDVHDTTDLNDELRYLR